MPNLKANKRPGRLAEVLGTAWASLMVTAGTALAETPAAHGAAAEHGGAAEHASSGLPQLDPNNFAPQLFWLAISFGALYYLMSRVALPKVSEVLEARQERIAHDLDKAAALKDESSVVMASYERALAEARSQSQAVMAETTAEIDAENSRRQAELMADLGARLKESEARIAAAKEAALANVRSVATDVAAGVASKLAGLEVDAAKAEGAVAAVMKERG